MEVELFHCIKAGWLKWREVSRVLYDRMVPLKLKGKILGSLFTLAMMYGYECWSSKKDYKREIEVTRMRMLRWTCGITLLDRNLNTTIRNLLGVTWIVEN